MSCIECTDITPANICLDFELGTIAGGIQDIEVQFENVSDGSLRIVEVETDANGLITLTNLEANIIPNVIYMVTLVGDGTFTLTDGTTVTGCVRLNFKHYKGWSLP